MTRSTRTVGMAHNALECAIRFAEANDLVGRNVASLVRSPPGKRGRPSRSLTADQVAAVLEAAKSHRMHAYVVLCPLTGIRTEEARALLWSPVDLEGGRTVAVWRSVRSDGDVKTERSRRTLRLPQVAVTALLAHRPGKTSSGRWPARCGPSTEEIARLVGHSSTRNTEGVHRRELRPVLQTGADIMDEMFGAVPEAGPSITAIR
jgi:integrase